jgi:hypothetical protein
VEATEEDGDARGGVDRAWGRGINRAQRHGCDKAGRRSSGGQMRRKGVGGWKIAIFDLSLGEGKNGNKSK